MGSRGAASGKADNGKEYGTEFKKVFESGNIKFIRPTSHESELFETMTKGRVYVTVTGDGIGYPKSIYYFDSNNKKVKNIDLTHAHDGKKPHIHRGYEHASEGTTGLLPKEKRMVDRVYMLWYGFVGK